MADDRRKESEQTVQDFLDEYENYKVAGLKSFCGLAAAAAEAEHRGKLGAIAARTPLTERTLRSFAMVGRMLASEFDDLCKWRDVEGEPLTQSHLIVLAACNRLQRAALLREWWLGLPSIVKVRSQEAVLASK